MVLYCLAAIPIVSQTNHRPRLEKVLGASFLGGGWAGEESDEPKDGLRTGETVFFSNKEQFFDQIFLFYFVLLL